MLHIQIGPESPLNILAIAVSRCARMRGLYGEVMDMHSSSVLSIERIARKTTTAAVENMVIRYAATQINKSHRQVK